MNEDSKRDTPMTNPPSAVELKACRRLAEEFVAGFTPDERGGIGLVELVEEAFEWLDGRSIPEAVTSAALQPQLQSSELVEAWRFELARARCDDGTYTDWVPPQLSFTKPCVPEGSIRNLTPLYSSAAIAAIDHRSSSELVETLVEAAFAGNAWPQHTLKADEAACEARQILARATLASHEGSTNNG